VDLLITGVLQGMTSYPFFDPVLTDRCFLTKPKAMVHSFVVGGSMAGLFIMFYSLIGVYGNMLGSCVDAGACPSSDLGTMGAVLSSVKAGVPSAVSKTFGEGIFSIINIIMITTSMSTLDSTFSSVAKLVGPDISGFWHYGRPLSLKEGDGELAESHVLLGRLAIVALAILGTLPVLMDPSELSATTASGTVVAGLGPPIYMLAVMPKEWVGTQVRPLAFHVPFWSGVLIGIIYQLRKDYKDQIDLSPLDVGDGAYKTLLGVNICSAVTCLALYLVFSLEWCFFSSEEVELEPKEEVQPMVEALEGNGHGEENGEAKVTVEEPGNGAAIAADGSTGRMCGLL